MLQKKFSINQAFWRITFYIGETLVIFFSHIFIMVDAMDNWQTRHKLF